MVWCLCPDSPTNLLSSRDKSWFPIASIFICILHIQVIEHVANPSEFSESLLALTAPNGATLVSTINRSMIAYATAIVATTEYILGWGFGEKCTPRGQCTFDPWLSEDDIKLLALFVKSKAENGWPKIEGDGD